MDQQARRSKGTVLYYVPPSFYSQIARLVLDEKGIDHERVVVAAGPPTYESYQPWYMHLNRMGTVPTLVVDGESIDDSRAILQVTEQRFGGSPLLPVDDEQCAKVEYWVEEAYQIPERVLAYGTGRLKAIGERTNRGRLKALRKWLAKMPEMSEIYEAKIGDIESFMREAADSEKVESAWSDTRQKLDSLDSELAQSTYCCGDVYTLADVVWTVTIARQLMLGSEPFEDRPALRAWFERMKARPSYRKADVWSRFKPEVMLPILLYKLKWHVLAIVTLLGLVTAGIFFVMEA